MNAQDITLYVLAGILILLAVLFQVMRHYEKPNPSWKEPMRRK